MATTKIYTFVDVRASMLDLGNSPTTDAITLRKINRSIQTTYDQFLGSRNWAIGMKRTRIVTNAQYNTGTIAYTNSTRTATLTGGTFPSWAALGRISFGSPALEYQVVSATGSTLVLSINVNPGADVVAGTAYNLFQDQYPLPVDCQSVGTIKDAQRNVVLQYMEPNDWVAMRPYNTYATVPRFFTIMRDPSYLGSLCIALLPPPDVAYNLDFMYKSIGRPFTCYQYNTGTITTSGTAVTGTGTTFTSNMVGCIIRASSSRTLPTGMEGSNPYFSQRVVTAYTSATSVTLDQAFDSDVTGVAYEISDPIDLEATAMYTAFLRRCEADFAPFMRRDDVPLLKGLAHDAWLEACEMDSRSFDMKPEGARYFQRVPTYWTVQNNS